MFEKISQYVDKSFSSFDLEVDWTKLFWAVVIGVLGLILLRLITFLVNRIVRKRLSDQTSMLIQKVIFYLGLGSIVIVVLSQLGVNLTALLGAAGIVGIAVGFAAQTSVSNVISGVFLISEKSFEVGDVLKVDDTTGIVVSIDLLAIKLKTFDNRFIRIPNETVIKTKVENITRYPIRRLDVDLLVDYQEDLETVRDILIDIGKNNPYCLDEPEPLIIFKNFGDSGIEILFGIWFYKTDYIQTKNSIMIDVKKRFAAENISIPYPHITIKESKVAVPSKPVGFGD